MSVYNMSNIIIAIIIIAVNIHWVLNDAELLAKSFKWISIFNPHQKFSYNYFFQFSVEESEIISDGDQFDSVILLPAFIICQKNMENSTVLKCSKITRQE